MKFINSHDEKISKTITEISFNIKGEIIQEQGEKVFSKALSIDLGNNQTQKKYFVRFFNNTPLDPFGPEARREIWNRTELKQVPPLTFENYNNYLLTRNKLFWTKVNRSFING